MNPTSGLPLGLADIERAAKRLGSRVHRTPLLSFRTAGERRGGELYLKCENLQRTGSFKARGALHFVLNLPGECLGRGVITYSSGNHGAAVAWAASAAGSRATVFVPEDIPASKRAAIEGYGGKVVVAGRTSADRRAAAERAASRDGGTIVPPFDDPHVIAGQGTAGLEITEQAARIDRVLVPVGGGGLIAGVATAIKGRFPAAKVIGVEPEGAPSMQAAFAAGKPTPITLGETVADGLRPIMVGELNYAIARERVDQLLTVADSCILEAIGLLFERARLVVEPSGAVTLAAYLHREEIAADGVTVLVLSGGNVDRARLNALLG
ncbi:MAG: threonine/serine dehydratase [Planctomycetota bacterium]